MIKQTMSKHWKLSNLTSSVQEETSLKGRHRVKFGCHIFLFFVVSQIDILRNIDFNRAIITHCVESLKGGGVHLVSKFNSNNNCCTSIDYFGYIMVMP